MFTAVQVMLTSGAGIDMASVGSFARMVAPTGGAAPLAGQVEYRWPVSRGMEPAGLPGDDDVLSLLDDQDLRQQMTGLTASTPLRELRDSFAVAASLPGWASGMCAAVEAEIRAGELGPAAREWVISSAGLTRLVLTFAIRNTEARPSGTAVTALGLIFVRNLLRALRPLLPAGNFEVLDNPLSVPPFLAAFLRR